MTTTSQTHLMTVEEFMNIDDDFHRHELIKGELLTMTPPEPPHGHIVVNLIMLLAQHVLVDDTIPGFRVKVSEIFA